MADTIFMRAVFGPFNRTENKVKGEIDWYFNAISEANACVHYKLKFRGNARNFLAVFISSGADFMNGGKRWGPERSTEEDSDLFVPDKPMAYGRTVAEILTNSLPDAEKAYAVAFAMILKR